MKVKLNVTISPEVQALIDEGRAIDDRLRGYSKECLVQALSSRIFARARMTEWIDGDRKAAIEREFAEIDSHKNGARFENVHRRLKARLESIRNPKPKGRRRRKRRKAWSTGRSTRKTWP